MYAASEPRATAFARRAQLASLMMLGCVSLVLAADKVAELSDDFLEYLGSMEGNEENWTDFMADGLAQDAMRDVMKSKDGKSVVSASSSSAASVTTKAASTATGKADK